MRFTLINAIELTARCPQVGISKGSMNCEKFHIQAQNVHDENAIHRYAPARAFNAI